MTAHRVLTVDPRYADSNRRALVSECLGEGYELVIPASYEPEALKKEAATAAAIITAYRPLTAELMAAAPRLRVVGKAGTGVDSIDVRAATARGLPVTNVPGALRASSMAEHVFTFMLILSRHPWLWESKPVPHVALEGAVLGIVGLGEIGKAVAGRASAFGMKIIAHTRTGGKFRPEGYSVEETASLEALLPRADYLVLCVPLSPETDSLIGEKELARMKTSAFLINVARGRVVDTDALVKALGEGHIAGAGLDVTDPEPLPGNHPLRGFPNAVVSPHIGALNDRIQRTAIELMCRNIRLAVEGERPEFIVNPEIFG
jgi:D-3-phosphoglycerate dehydrogenase